MTNCDGCGQDYEYTGEPGHGQHEDLCGDCLLKDGAACVLCEYIAEEQFLDRSVSGAGGPVCDSCLDHDARVTFCDEGAHHALGHDCHGVCRDEVAA